MTLKIGPLTLPNPWLLAPLEEVSDIGFRHLCTTLGAGWSCTEMIRASGLVRKNKATLDLIDSYEPCGLQLLTKGPKELELALKVFFTLRESTHSHFKNITFIDLNFGCPSPEVIRIGLGPAMLKRMAKMEATFKTLKQVVKVYDKNIAVGAKLRLGLNQQEKDRNIVDRLIPAINQHLDYIIIHAKHAGQRGSEKADWSALKELREKVTIPFIANGSGLDANSASELKETTKADAVLIARGAITNPWIFRALNEKGSEQATLQEIENAKKEYLETSKKYHTKEKYVAFHKENFSRITNSMTKKTR